MILETAVSHSFNAQLSRLQAIGKALVVTRMVNCAAVGNPTVSGVWQTRSRSTAVSRMIYG
jgi:hypothetical protein